MDKPLEDFAEIADAVISTLTSKRLSALNNKFSNFSNRNSNTYFTDRNKNGYRPLNNSFVNNRRTPTNYEPFHYRNSKVCGYQCRFGKKSRLCTTWCEWPNKSNIQMSKPRPRDRSLSFQRDNNTDRSRPQHRKSPTQGNQRALSQ